jgi:hypothetical protein
MAKLTDIQKKKLPPELRVVLERFNHEPQLLMKLKQLLSLAAQHIAQQSLNHDTFCDFFQPPNKLPNELLKLYGMTSKELKNALRKVGFDQRNAMYDSTYYQTFVIAYLIGLQFDDENIRKLALLMISIRIWNGRKKKSFPTYCDPDIARYVLNYVLQGNHTLKKAGSAFEYIDQHSIPHIDKVYKDRIANNLNHEREGLRKLIETIWSRYEQLFKSMRNAYYKTHQEGKKEIISDKYSQQYGNGDMVENKESFSGNIERLVDKIEKNAMLKKNVLLKPEAIKVFKDRFNISTAGIQKINNWIEDEENQDELKYFFELLFTTLKPRNEQDICKYDVQNLAYKVTGAKKDPNLLKAKEIINHALEEILGEKYRTLGTQSIYNYRPMMAYAFIIYAKIMLCKKL